MNNLLRKIDSYLLILLLELFLVVTLSTFISNSNLSILDFIMLCATFFMVMITYIGGGCCRSYTLLNYHIHIC